MVAPLPSGLGSPADVGVSRNLMTVQLVARDLLTRGPGDRIPTALQYQHLTGVGSGTVQKALRTLQSTGAVSLRSRGRHPGPDRPAQTVGSGRTGCAHGGTAGPDVA